MCVAFWSLEHPDYALILCSNRDEFLSRPTEHAHFHSFGHLPEPSEQGAFVLSGRDLQAGGTWFGINRAGRVALLTNITEPVASYASSRGHLVSSFLAQGGPDWDSFVHGLTTSDVRGPSLPKFAGFNLLVFSPSVVEAGTPRNTEGENKTIITYEKAALITNSGGGGVVTCRSLTEDERRIGGLSNGVDGQGACDWPKVVEGRTELGQLFQTLKAKEYKVDENELVEELFKILLYQSSSRPLNRSQLRNSIQIPPLHMTSSLDPNAHALARPCGPSEDTIVPPQGEVYATRLSTVVLVRRDGSVLFIERDIWKLASGLGIVEENGSATSDGPCATTAHTHIVTNSGANTFSTQSGGTTPSAQQPLASRSTTVNALPHIPEVVRGNPRDDRVFRFTLRLPDAPGSTSSP